jgi:hypothetical protein
LVTARHRGFSLSAQPGLKHLDDRLGHHHPPPN